MHTHTTSIQCRHRTTGYTKQAEKQLSNNPHRNVNQLMDHIVVVCLSSGSGWCAWAVCMGGVYG